MQNHAKDIYITLCNYLPCRDSPHGILFTCAKASQHKQPFVCTEYTMNLPSWHKLARFLERTQTNKIIVVMLSSAETETNCNKTKSESQT